MNELLEAMKAWPVLVQGTVSSAIFWLVLLVGQKITSMAVAAYSKRSRVARRSYVVSRLYKFRAFNEKDAATASFYVSAVLFRASRPAIRALMWLVAGLMLNSVISHLGIVAFAACLYFLFKAYSVVAPYSMEMDHAAEIRALEQELAALKQEP